MSGTSMDGVDVALIDTDGERAVRQGPASFLPYNDEDRSLLRRAMAEAVALQDRNARPGALADAEAMITERHATAVEVFLDAQQLSPDQIGIVGFHGQTVLHKPRDRLTVQIGDAVALTRRLGIRVVHDFRAADVAAGGQGAPLVPVYHRALAEAAGFSGALAVVNIGGVANISFCVNGADPIACDTGPGNALIDDLMLERTGVPLDRDGAMAQRGCVNEPALVVLMAHPFFQEPPPKSLDRNVFSLDQVAALSTPDAAATLAAFTAESVARLILQFPVAPGKIIVCGGGAKNPVIMRELAARTGATVCAAEVQGWSADAMEAQAFAYLAVRTLKGLPLTFPSTTGVRAPMTGGTMRGP